MAEITSDQERTIKALGERHGDVVVSPPAPDGVVKVRTHSPIAAAAAMREGLYASYLVNVDGNWIDERTNELHDQEELNGTG